MENFFQRVVGKNLENDVDMVGHHTPSEKMISHTIELPQCRYNHIGDRAVAQETRPNPSIKMSFDPSGA